MQIRLVGAQPLATKRLLSVAVFISAFAVGLLGCSALLRQDHAAAAGCGITNRNYQEEDSVPAAYGLDGYIMKPPGTIASPQCDSDSNWFGINGSGGNFAAIGVTIGITQTGYLSTYHAYSDGVNVCGTYHFEDLQTPPAANTAYYVQVNSLTSTVVCGTSAWSFAYRIGSVFNTPVGYRTINVSNGPLTADREVVKTSSSWPNPGTAYWGHQTTTTFPLAYGLAWFDYPSGQTWNEWSASVTTNINHYEFPSGIAQNYTFCGDSSYRAFHVVKVGTSC